MADPVVERLADNTLLLVQELRNGAKQSEKIAESLHNATEAMLAVRREVHDGNAALDGHQHELRAALVKIGERLAVIGKDVDDVERVTREATGAHALSVRHEGNAGVLRAFGELPSRAQVLIVVVAVIAILSGWLHMIFK